MRKPFWRSLPININIRDLQAADEEAGVIREVLGIGVGFDD